MGLIHDPRLRAQDNAGNIYPNAVLYTFDASATTTPKATYTDNTLGSALANPVPCDSDGYFPQLHAEAGQGFYLVMRTNTVANGGLIIKTFSNIVALESEASADMLRTLTDARWKVSSGPIEGGGPDGVIDESGLPSPTDVGGNRRFGGWGGSQGNEVVFDFESAKFTEDVEIVGATTLTGGITGDVAATGDVTVKSGKKLPHISWTSATFSAASTVDITIPTGYDVFDIDITDLVVSSAQEIRCRLSYDNGSNYKSGASDYTSQSVVNGTLVATGTTTFFTLHTLGTSTAMKSEVRLRLNTTSTASVATTISGTARAQLTSMSMFAGETATQYGRATNIRFYMAAGTMTGRYRLIAHRGLAGTDA